jgi:hypothetical protein
MTVKWVIVASIFAIVAAVVVGLSFGGRYTTQQGPHGLLYVVDRFTGSVRACGPQECWPVFNRAESTVANSGEWHDFPAEVPKK